MERTLQALTENAAIARTRGATIIAVGTSALRDASNSEGFLRVAEKALGVPIEVISGGREAELAFRGGVFGLKVPDQIYTVVDVGGGSTEIILGRGVEIVETISVEIGAVRFFERYPLTSPASPQQLALVEREVEKTIAQSQVRPVEPLIAIGGTATTLAAIAGAIEPYEPTRIHGARLTMSELSDLCNRLASMSLDKRRQVRGLKSSRADIIVTGTIILKAIAKAAKAEVVVVSNGGVRFGLAQETYGNMAIDYGTLSV
jgi:exopolyphosphatase/guanosine-5'-triphosphate,3'-diphosphate pyrophosphatase